MKRLLTSALLIFAFFVAGATEVDLDSLVIVASTGEEAWVENNSDQPLSIAVVSATTGELFQSFVLPPDPRHDGNYWSQASQDLDGQVLPPDPHHSGYWSRIDTNGQIGVFKVIITSESGQEIVKTIQVN